MAIDWQTRLHGDPAMTEWIRQNQPHTTAPLKDWLQQYRRIASTAYVKEDSAAGKALQQFAVRTPDNVARADGQILVTGRGAIGSTVSGAGGAASRTSGAEAGVRQAAAGVDQATLDRLSSYVQAVTTLPDHVQQAVLNRAVDHLGAITGGDDAMTVLANHIGAAHPADAANAFEAALREAAERL